MLYFIKTLETIFISPRHVAVSKETDCKSRKKH